MLGHFRSHVVIRNDKELFVNASYRFVRVGSTESLEKEKQRRGVLAVAELLGFVGADGSIPARDM